VTTAGQKRFIIRLRWERGAYTSPAMPQHEAEHQAEALHQEVYGCGDGPRFVAFTGWDGRTLRVRGREVIAVECIPHREDLPAGMVVPQGTHAFDARPDRHDDGAGTSFLRRLSGVQR
jgi:hypothetical protein